MGCKKMKTIIVGMTGASGSIYGLRLIEELAKKNFKIHVVATAAAMKVVPFETGQSVENFIKTLKSNNHDTTLEEIDNFFSKIASGSYQTAGMIIAPCSMGTLAKMAHGISTNLLIRAADVCLKERRPLVVLARETPLNRINLENMLTLTTAGAMIYPASPGFYHRPETLEEVIDFMVGKVLDAFEVEHDLFERWGACEVENKWIR